MRVHFKILNGRLLGNMRRRRRAPVQMIRGSFQQSVTDSFYTLLHSSPKCGALHPRPIEYNNRCSYIRRTPLIALQRKFALRRKYIYAYGRDSFAGPRICFPSKRLWLRHNLRVMTVLYLDPPE